MSATRSSRRSLARTSPSVARMNELRMSRSSRPARSWDRPVRRMAAICSRISGRSSHSPMSRLTSFFSGPVGGRGQAGEHGGGVLRRLERGEEKPVLVTEVVVDECRVDPGPGGHGAHGGALEPAFREQFPGLARSGLVNWWHDGLDTARRTVDAGGPVLVALALPAAGGA